MPKPYAYLQTMTKGLAKCQIDRYKTVGGVAHTRYPLQCTLVVFKPQQWLRSKAKKSNKNLIVDNAKITCISTDLDRRACKVSKNCMRSYAHKVPTICRQISKLKKRNNSRRRTPTEKQNKSTRATARSPEWNSHCRRAALMQHFFQFYYCNW